MKTKNPKSPDIKQKHKQSFMSKFKDKHSIISKEGLMNLFQNKKKSLQIKMKKHTNEQKEPSEPTKVQKQKHQIKINEIIRQRSMRKGSTESVSKSLQLNQVPKKLPAIHKSLSTAINLREKVSPVSIIKPFTDDIPKPLKKSPPQIKDKRVSQNYMFELDKFALDHLDFLQKFQERIRKRQQLLN